MNFITVSCLEGPVSKNQFRVVINPRYIMSVWERLSDHRAVIVMEDGSEHTTVNLFDDVKEKIRLAS